MAIKKMDYDELREFLRQAIREGKVIATPTHDEQVEYFQPQCLLESALRAGWDVYLTADDRLRVDPDMPLWAALAFLANEEDIATLMTWGYADHDWRERLVKVALHARQTSGENVALGAVIFDLWTGKLVP
jgi:hypothetical protein